MQPLICGQDHYLRQYLSKLSLSYFVAGRETCNALTEAIAAVVESVAAVCMETEMFNGEEEGAYS